MKKLEGKVAVITGGNSGMALPQHNGLSQTEHMYSSPVAVNKNLIQQ
jgi:hypothetical protein